MILKKTGTAFLRVILVILLTLLAVGGSIVCFKIYLKGRKLSIRSINSKIRKNVMIEDRFAEKYYKEFLEVLAKSDRKTFGSVWDYDEDALLSRESFLPTEMYGVTKYRYRPNITVINTYLWTGLGYQIFCLNKTVDIEKALSKCETDRYIEFDTDEHGFKKTSFTAGKKDRTIFFLGDSFTEGLFVESKKTFVNLYGSLLKKHGYKYVPVNLGVNGYSALEMSWMLEHFAPVMNPAAVIINLFPNDLHYDYLAYLNGDITLPRKNYTEMFNYLQRMNTYCKKNNISMFISTIPAREQLDKPDTLKRFQEPVGDWCKRNDVVYLDPTNYFKLHGKDKIYFSWDVHFSESGHRKYADFLFSNTKDKIE